MYKDIIQIEVGKRGGLPIIRGMRISVFDILGWLGSGMSVEDIHASLQFAADREKYTRYAQTST